MHTVHDWHGLYSESWTNEIVPDAFSHPAKFARGLIRRIYEHAIEEGWLVEGDTVIDPFAGVALGGLDAMFHGLNWVGVELEDKFVSLGGQNVALWNSRYGNGMLPQWGTAVILRGDSRQLCEVLDGARAKGVVASPPYAASATNGARENRAANLEQAGIDSKKWLGRRRCTQGRSEGYGTNPANLGNMREGDHEAAVRAVVSSPPYHQSVERWGKQPNAMMQEKSLYARYGDHDGQLAAMPEGDVDAVISSPPWSQQQDGGRKLLDQRDQMTIGRRACGYRNQGDTPGQLAAMPEGDVKACISSPPYEKSMDSGDENARARLERTDGFKQGMDTFRYGQNPFTFLSKDPSGLNNQQRHELAAQNPQMGALQGDTFWSAARVIVSQCYQVLAPGGHAIWVVKDFVRNKEIVPFCEQWREMCESCGFETLHKHRCWLVEDKGGQYALNGDLVEKKVERKSFFRRLYEKKYPENSIDYEIVWCMRKAV